MMGVKMGSLEMEEGKRNVPDDVAVMRNEFIQCF
jgi:hypothetical protein